MKQWTISPLDQQKRIDVFVSEKMDLSRSKSAAMIRDGKILHNGIIAKANIRLNALDVVSAASFEVKPIALEPVPMALDIIYEDSELLIVNKPSGLMTHPGKGKPQPTLLHGLLHHLNDGRDAYLRPGLVHRLDKDTSGLLLVAKNDKVHHLLAQQVMDKTMKRFYLAVVHHEFHDDNRVVDAPIGPDPKQRTHMKVNVRNSRKALTRVIRRQANASFSLLECRLETGRTHQIRVHCQHIGFPLVGDPLYGHPDDSNKKGQLLCGYHLEFIHPKTQAIMVFEIEMPPSFFPYFE